MYDCMWLKYLLQGPSFHRPIFMTLKHDNQSAIYSANNSVFYETTKHIEVDYHFVRYKVLEEVIQTVHVRSLLQFALTDLVTKSLGLSE